VGYGKGGVCLKTQQRGGKWSFEEIWRTLVAPLAEGANATGTFKVAGQGSSWAHPVVIDGRLYLRYDTNLYCYNVRAR
jgi:hypothetical protein